MPGDRHPAHPHHRTLGFQDVTKDLPNVDATLLDIPSVERLRVERPSTHPPRILLLYGSCRERSYSRLLTFEAERLLAALRRHDPGLRSARPSSA